MPRTKPSKSGKKSRAKRSGHEKQFQAECSGSSEIGAGENLLPYISKFLAHLDFLGTVLGIADYAQATLQGNQSADSKCLNILNRWLQVCPNATWKMFCDALKKYDKAFAGVRMQIQRDHGIGTQPSSTSSAQTMAGTTATSTTGDGTSSADVSQHIYYPVIDDLKISFSNLAGNVLSIIGSLSLENLETFCYFLLNYLKPSFPHDAPLPVIPKTVQDLQPFLIHRWDPLQIALLKAVVQHLASCRIQAENFKSSVQQIKAELNAYEDLLKGKLHEFLSKCRSESVSLKPLLGHSSVSVKIASKPENISLAQILKFKGFYVNNLGLPDTLFLGFSEGCIVLFFSIPTECVWSLSSSCLHPSNLSLLEEWRVLFFSVKGAFTVDIKERRVVHSLDKLIRPILNSSPMDTQPSSTTSQTMAGTTATSATAKLGLPPEPILSFLDSPPDDRSNLTGPGLALSSAQGLATANLPPHLPPVASLSKQSNNPSKQPSAQGTQLSSTTSQTMAGTTATSTTGPTAPRTRMDEKIGYGADIYGVPEYRKGLIGEMRMLGSVLGIGEDTKAILRRHGSLDDHLVEILDLYIEQKTPTWKDFCKALKRLACFNSVRAKIEADHK